MIKNVMDASGSKVGRRDAPMPVERRGDATDAPMAVREPATLGRTPFSVIMLLHFNKVLGVEYYTRYQS